ncbi:MAG: 1-acyl-sn-glycerol-3-phosphate acyltransferase [Legionella sp. 40-6]|nr:1-acyl-sn-glycerol-3-phosphate acyltransferase [Legionella sp.]OJY51958.1 MAG: 1-acyl-sn-glycerol-3-phosphate acyltransferase [Legionella sp. 40-6]
MKLNQFKTAMIISGLMVYTAYQSICSILGAYWGTKRHETDQRLQNWADRLLNQVQVHYKIINPHHAFPQPGKATIIMCNHSSAYDIPLSLKIFPKHSIRMLAKKELFNVPIFGKGMAAAEFPFINRKNRYEAIKDLARVKELMLSGIVIWISPEGTRSKDGSLGAFKKGGFITAIQSQATIIPVGIRGANNILPARSFNMHLHQKAEVHIGKPIDASKYSLENKEVLMAEVREAILNLMGNDVIST